MSCSVVEPGKRGIKVTLGEVAPQIYPEGVVWHTPMIGRVISVDIRQQAGVIDAECYSSDLQQVNIKVKILYKIPEQSVLPIYKEYTGNPFDNLVASRIFESLKEVTATETAEGIVKKRESIKQRALEQARNKVGALIIIDDIVLENITLTDQLENAIEQKMVQEQEAAKAKFVKLQAEVEAETAIIKAKGEAEAIRVRGDAIRNNPFIVELKIIEKWDGKSPLVVGGGKSANILLPIKEQ